jgi:hypothetical protein
MFFSHPQRLKFVFPGPSQRLKGSDAPDMRPFALLLSQNPKTVISDQFSVVSFRWLHFRPKQTDG